MLLNAAILAVLVWAPAEGQPGTGTNYFYDVPAAIGNGLSADNISTEEVCRVILVGTNSVDVTSFLGMTNFPAEAENWWSIWSTKTNGTAGSLTGNEGASAASARQSDAQATFSLSHAIPQGDNSAMTLTIPTSTGPRVINFDPASYPTGAIVFQIFRASILAIVGLSVGFIVIREWRVVVGRISDARQAHGFGADVLGNNAPFLFAQINAGIMTLIISAAIVAITATVVSFVGGWITNAFSSIPTGGLAGICFYLFNLAVPVDGLFIVGGVYLGWCVTAASGEYLVKVAARHTTT